MFNGAAAGTQFRWDIRHRMDYVSGIVIHFRRNLLDIFPYPIRITQRDAADQDTTNIFPIYRQISNIKELKKSPRLVTVDDKKEQIIIFCLLKT